MPAKDGILLAAKRAGLFALARRATRGSLRILCYHGIWPLADRPFGNRLFIPPALFRARMRRLKESGCPVLALDDAVRRLKDDSLPDRATVITIDDGWHSTHEHMLPALEEFGLPATIYVTTWYVENRLPVVNVLTGYLLQFTAHAELELAGIADGLEGRHRVGDGAVREALAGRIAAAIDALSGIDARLAACRRLAERAGVELGPVLDQRCFHMMSDEQLRDAHRRGFDIQLHTHRHIDVNRKVEQLADEIAENRRVLARIIGTAPASFRHFCYPSGAHHPRAAAILDRLGVASSTMTEEGINGRGQDVHHLLRFLDGRSVPQIEFDAYLSGFLEYFATAVSGARALVGGRRKAG
jgi:peptidoglycan/xylan/chitin deacetylase (PgdA/CDA1 family)